MSLAQALFAPRAVAVVGASTDATKNTARPARYLQKHGYAGRICLVNPTRAEMFPSVPEGVEHGYIVTGQVEQALEDCGKRGVAVASIFSGGFADAGAEGLQRQRRLVARARELGVRLLGPNSMGVINVPGRMALSVNAVLEMEELPAGATSIVSQSGTMLGTLLSRGAARGMGFAKLVSVGNEADVGVGELVELLGADPDTQVILLFLETVRDAGRLARAARAAGKPIVAYKLGRSALGEAAALTHTGALAGSDAALDAYFRDCGIVRVDMLETLLEICPLVAGRAAPDLRRPGKVSVVTTTGGGAASVVDRLGVLGVELAGPIHDLTMAGTQATPYAAALEKAMASDCDAVVAAVGSSAQFHPQLAVQPIIECPRSKPLAAFFTPQADRSLALAAANGIAAFRTPEACADALAAFFAWRAPRKFGDGALTPQLGLSLDPFELVARLGIPVAPWAIAQAPVYEHAVAYPVAVKRLEAHKTERGGVALGIRDRGEFEQTVKRLGAERVLVQRMEAGLAEAIVGYRVDAVVGPLVLVGMGGVLTEVYRDIVVRLAPVSAEEAREMIERVKGFAAIRGYRNLPRGDVAALANAVSALSRLALVPRVREAEINPLIVKADGVVAVDALVARQEEA